MPASEISVIEAFDEALRAGSMGDDNRRWELISHLHVHGGIEALEQATRWSGHPEPTHRMLAADVLSQLGSAPGRSAIDGPFREESLALLLTMVQNERDPGVLSSLTTGFGHIGDERSLASLVNLRAHPDAQVRFGIVFGLLRCPITVALDVLIKLSADDDAQVRDWATFGLARHTDEDVPRLRRALADRLDDDDPDTRIEAVHGLATRGDPRAMQPLLDILETPSDPSDPGLVSEARWALAATSLDPPPALPPAGGARPIPGRPDRRMARRAPDRADEIRRAAAGLT
ncbi:HEAT repeat domain-containing protein [Actinoplanes sp. LDG1-06]|uniref:HEAT repeat domain-containing protein n=1 Tax=Paractinoplanes ovalisporus TaxID=2810368 RepID=A0ABS2AVD9_9ACTN|nr:HEAT repeat domain-containing protein [Actinoplanes ovalisporus]MBM2623151.1 HEAT repeat domain-containing protein [Actinoplanes ovalisporus]